ncbi:TusE/DsrC/DsvC family sulfur relay protein [Neptunomonas antarctica]|uniref:Sulfurtransferase n=1 Tax=Neptunomonas antarctica TaxID=619304 RepID=A0A1N7PJ71_9GAMM|nr:TusE/DsrC/DsvC family sulfur relay protein [Neptunomonas antarctica]SIT10606.1 tRNA 2-thiouridine synthesizing protein E [Neptunomonas antarctica]
MRHITIADKDLTLDDEGYLLDLTDWSEAVAEYLSNEEQIQLTDAHWEIIHVIRDFYRQYELSPAMRPLVKAVGITLGDDKGKSIYLMKLFPQSPAKQAAKLAGLPKPTNCL